MVSSQQPTTEQIFDHLRTATIEVRKFEEDRTAFLERPAYPKTPKTPSEWFQQKFPEQVKTFGCPFIELKDTRGDGLTKTTPLAMNHDFFGAILGGDSKLGHKVVYIPGELQWYFYDPRDKIFKPTSPEKLQNLLRAYLIKCAEDLSDATVNKLSLFIQFRSDKEMKTVMQRAKSILAADETFFSAESKNMRLKGTEVHERLARVFVEQALEREPGQVLTLTNAYLVFCEYLRTKGLEPVKRSIFKSMFAPLVRDCFDLGLRNDVVDEKTQKQTAGWKGLHVDFKQMSARG